MKTLTKAQQRELMPKKKYIASYWGFPIDELDYCWGCGCSDTIHRAHLKARINEGNNGNPSNFILLCKFCHNHIQESLSSNDSNAESMRILFKNIHLPFFNIKVNHLLCKAKAGLYPFEILKKLDYSKINFFQIKPFKEILNENTNNDRTRKARLQGR